MSQTNATFHTATSLDRNTVVRAAYDRGQIRIDVRRRDGGGWKKTQRTWHSFGREAAIGLADFIARTYARKASGRAA